MNVDFWQTVGLCAIFIILLLIIAKVAGKKAQELLEILIKGAKKEFTTRPGGISLITVIIVALVAMIFILVTEVRTAFLAITGLENEKNEVVSFAVGIFSILSAMLLNFSFIAYMSTKDKED